MNVTVCSGTKAKISCGYTGVSDFFNTIPDWRIVKRSNNGSVISNITVSGVDIRRNKIDDLRFAVVENDNSADGSYLSVGPVDDTYNNTSYQCIFTINDNIIESDTAGTVTVIGMYTTIITYIFNLFKYVTIYVLCNLIIIIVSICNVIVSCSSLIIVRVMQVGKCNSLRHS